MAAHDEMPGRRSSIWHGIGKAEIGPSRRGSPSYQFPDFSRAEIGSPGFIQKQLKIYLAGPIEKHCWRHQLVPDLGNAAPGEAKTLPLGKHLYVGPFFVGGQHGQTHGPTDHGVGLNEELHGFTQKQIRDFCRAQIASADVIFAWIDREHAYGTIWELGYAASFPNKKIIVRWPTTFDISEMWLSLTEDAKPTENVVEAFNEVVLLLSLTPIEKILLDALLRVQPTEQKRFVLKAQYEVLNGKYRLDFAIWAEDKPWRVAVECDGDWHERNKEQVARDKARTRELTREGWTVLHFSGTEITKNADTCAHEITAQCLRLDQ